MEEKEEPMFKMKAIGFYKTALSRQVSEEGKMGTKEGALSTL